MNIQKKLTIIIAGMTMMTGLIAGAVSVDPATAPITLGRWHSDLYKAEAYSKQHDIPMVFIWGSIGCSYCNKMDTYVDTEVFKNWMAQRKLVMVYLKQAVNKNPPEMWYGSEGLNGSIREFPFVSVYWNSKNTKIYNFVGRYYNQSSPANAQALINRIESYMGQYTSQAPQMSQGITVNGREGVLDNVSEQYSAVYRDALGIEQDVSDSVIWSINDLLAGDISLTGLFTPFDLIGSKAVLVRAVYEIGGQSYQGERLVTVSDSDIPIGAPLSAAVGGPVWVQGGTSAQLTAMFNYENGPFEAGAENTFLWQVTEGPASINSGGLLTAGTVPSDTTATVYLRITTPRRVVFTATFIIAVTVNPPAAQYTLEIRGSESVNEGSITPYTAVLKADGAADEDVTALVDWGVSGPTGTAVDAGSLTAGAVTTDSTCTLTASYLGASATKVVTIIDIPEPVLLDHLEINGPATVMEGQSANYSCTAFYTDLSTSDVTAQADWSGQDGDPISILSGELVAGAVDQDTAVNLQADFGGKTTSFEVQIINRVATAILITGPESVNEGDIRNFICTATYSVGAPTDVTDLAEWFCDHSGSMIAAGELTAGGVSADTNCLITAVYDGITNVLSVQILKLSVMSLSPESFEAGLGEWQSLPSDGFEWTRHSGPTPSNGTGPDSAAQGDYYLYTEASDGNTNKVATLESPVFSLTDLSIPMLTFDFHMYGVGMGELHVDVYDGQWNTAVWSKTGMQQSADDTSWLAAEVNLTAFSGGAPIKVRLRGVTGENFLSDMAVDNLKLVDLTTQEPESYGDWALINGLAGDDADQQGTPQLDGIPNLLKYASGLDSLQHNTADYMSISNNPATSIQALYYFKDKSAKDVELVPLWTYSLSAFWMALPESVKVSESVDRELWMVVMPEGPSGFMKLRATLLD